jgi:hypothetical protein
LPDISTAIILFNCTLRSRAELFTFDRVFVSLLLVSSYDGDGGGDYSGGEEEVEEDFDEVQVSVFVGMYL